MHLPFIFESIPAMTATVVVTSKRDRCCKRSSPPRRWSQPSTLAATACVFELIETTTPALVVKKTPVVNVPAARHREALRRAKVLTAIDPTNLEIRSGDFYRDYAAESRMACLESKKDIRCFEERLTQESGGEHTAGKHRKEPALDAWSPDAVTLSEAAAAAAAQKGGRGTGPRVALTDAYSMFRHLRLTEKGITSIDPAFEHFSSLTELDLGQNRLQAIENLPKGLVTLSCAANELSGRALDGVRSLPLLASLDLAYNNLEVDSLLAKKPKLFRERPTGSSNGAVAAATPNADGAIGTRRRIRPPPTIAVSSPLNGSLAFHDKFAGLEHLDLSWNCLCDLDGLLRILSPLLGSLRHLFLMGNPACLLPEYRLRVLSGGCGSSLLVLDDLPVKPSEHRSAAAAAAGAAKSVAGAVSDGRPCARQLLQNGGAGSGSRKALDMVHFGVKLLSLARLPEIGGTAKSGEAAATTGAASASVATGAVGDSIEERTDPPRLKQWGEIEFLVPGNASNGDETRLARFPWAPEVVPPPSPPPPEGKQAGGSTGATGRSGGDHAVDGRQGACNNEPWNVAASVIPSKAVRDGVRFQGIRVLLFVLDEDKLHGGDATVVADEAEGERTENETPTTAIVPAPGMSTLESARKGETEDQSTAHEGSGSPSATHRPRMRQRRLVGSGHLSLSPFLDAAWMMREQQRMEQQRMAKQRQSADKQRKEEETAKTAASSNMIDAVVEAGARAGADSDPCGGAAAIRISGKCDIMLEPWVVDILRQGVARRNREREAKREAARLEAEAFAASDPKGKNAKAAAAAAAAAAAKGRDEEDRLEEEIELSPSASAQVEVSLNSDAAVRAFMSAGTTLGTVEAAAPVATAADAW